MSCLFTHPNLLICRVEPTKKARRVLRHGRFGMKRIDTLSQIIRRKSTIFFSNKRKKVKENALIDTKSLKFGQIICCKTYFTDTQDDATFL